MDLVPLSHDSSPSSRSSGSPPSTPEGSTSPEGLLPVPPPLEEPHLQEQPGIWRTRARHSSTEQTFWPDAFRGGEDFETQKTLSKSVSEKEGTKPIEQESKSELDAPEPSIKLSLAVGQFPDLELGHCNAPQEDALTWGKAKFEFREQGWCVKLTWDHAVSTWSNEAGGQEYSLYWRRNLEPWVLHKEGVQGSAEEVQLTERESVASYWFILRIEKPEEELVVTSPVLGPLIPPSAPGGVRQVIATEIAPGTIEVSWRPPSQFCSCEVTDYEVLLENERQQQALTVCRGTRVQITDVDPFHCYTVQVCAVNNLLGRGPYCTASFPVDIRHATLSALPIDGCPMQSWNDAEKAPIPKDERPWWVLDVLACLSALLATMAFDMELATSTYSRIEDPISMSLLLSIYLASGIFTTMAVDAAGGIVPAFVMSFLAKLAYVVVTAMYHLQVHAQSGQPAMDFRGWGAERSAMQWSLKASADFPELPELKLSRQMFFLLCMRGIAGGCAAAVKHLTFHVTLPSWAVSGQRWSGVPVSVLHSKCAPLGFACVAALSGAGLDRADAPYMLARALLFAVIISAFLCLLLGPHARRPAAALALSQASSRVMLRRCRSLCQAEVRRSIQQLLSGTKSSFTAEACHMLQNWDGPNRALWIWSGRSVLLLDDQSPLLGLRNACVLPTLVALLQRQMQGAEHEIIESFNCARSSALKYNAPPFSAQAQCIILDVITVSAALGEPLDDVGYASRRKRFLGDSTEKDCKELYSIADLHESLKQISRVSHVAVPCELLATTYVVTRTSQRPWLSCLGCSTCCRAPVLQHRLAVDHAKHSLRSSAEHEQSNAAKAMNQANTMDIIVLQSMKKKEWRGACPRWADVAAYVEQRFIASDKKYEKLIQKLFRMTNSSMADGTVDSASTHDFTAQYGTTSAERRDQFREFISQYQSHIGNNFLPAKESMELSIADVNSAAAFCSEAMSTAGMKKGRHVSIDTSERSKSDGNEALSLGFALSCLVLGKDTGAVSKCLDVGLNYCAKELGRSAVKHFPKLHLGKDKMKQLNKRLPRVLEALLRLRFFGTHCWTARIAHDVHTLVLECCALQAGGLEAFEVHDRLQITDMVHQGAGADRAHPGSPVAGRAHLSRPLAAVIALCRCDVRAVHELCDALLAEVGIKSGNALANGVFAVVDWLAAERANLRDRMTNVESMYIEEGDPIRSDALMLLAASALGFPSLTELSTVVGTCNILALQFGLSLSPSDGVSQIVLPGPGVCLGSVLNLMQVVGQDPECANYILEALADALMQHPRWQPFVDLVDRGKPTGFLGAVAARGGFEVPWAPTSQRDPDDVQVTSVLMEFYMRIVRSGCVPPPAPPVVAPVPDNEDFEPWILAYLGCHGDGLTGAEDAMLLIEAVTGERCEPSMYTQFCNQISRDPSVGITVEDAKALLKEMSAEQQEKFYRDLELGPGNFGEGVIRRAHKNRQLLEKKVTAATLSAWSLSDTLGLWLTHFFGPRAAQVGLVLPDDSAGGTASGSCCSCCCAGTVKRRGSPSEIRGLLALQARPEELARSWRSALERGVASLPSKVRTPQSRVALASLLAARHSVAGNKRPQRILPYNARAQLLTPAAPDSAPSAPETSKRSFQNDLCHSRTEMCRGGLRRDESRNLATLRRESTRWLQVYGLRFDLYTHPTQIFLAFLGVYEAGLLLLLPQFLITLDKGGRLGSEAACAGLAAGVLASSFLGQACGSWHQGRRVREVSTCPLPAPPKVMMQAIQGWETDNLACSVIACLGGELQVLAWRQVPASLGCHDNRPLAAVVVLLVTAAFLIGICRPLAETALLLRPRIGHFDGYQEIGTLNHAFVYRTVAAAVGLPLLLWYLNVEPELQVGQAHEHYEDPGYLAMGYYVIPSCEHYGKLGAALARLGRAISCVFIMALTPWLVSALNKWPYMHPVRRALHYCRPPRIEGSGGPPIDGHPVVSYMTMQNLVMMWPNPHSTRNLVYDIQVSISYGLWQPGSNLNIVWPKDRRRPSCRIAISSIAPGEAVRFRVRCAPVDSLETLQNDELGMEALIWGPWSTPSLIIRRPGAIRVVRPLFFLAILPVAALHTLLYSLPAAWLGSVIERKHKDCALRFWKYSLLLLIWPLVCIHILCWEFPRWAQTYIRNKYLCPVLIVPLSIVFLPYMFLNQVHRLKIKLRQSADVEELPFLIERGPPFALALAQGAVNDMVGSNSMSSDDARAQINILRDAGFNDDFEPLSYQHSSRVNLVSACTMVRLSVCTAGKDNTYIESILYMCSENDALDTCVGASVIESSESALSKASIAALMHRGHLQSISGNKKMSGAWLSTRRLQYQGCLLLLSEEVSADAGRLVALSSQAAASGAVGLLLVLDGSTRAPPSDTPSLHLPLFCITNASAVKLQDLIMQKRPFVKRTAIKERPASGVILGGISLCAEEEADEGVIASWKAIASWKSLREVHERIALQYQKVFEQDTAREVQYTQWTTCAIATLDSGSIFVGLPVADESHDDQFRILGYARGAWQPVSLPGVLSVDMNQPPVTFEYALGGMSTTIQKVCEACGSTSNKGSAKFCCQCGEPLNHGYYGQSYETQVPAEIARGLGKLSPVVAQLAKKHKTLPHLGRKSAQAKWQCSGRKAAATANSPPPSTALETLKASARHQLDTLPLCSPSSEHRSSRAPADLEMGAASLTIQGVADMAAASRTRGFLQPERDMEATSREPTERGFDCGRSVSLDSRYSPRQSAAPTAMGGSPLVGSSAWLAAGVTASRAARPQRYNNIDWLG